MKALIIKQIRALFTYYSLMLLIAFVLMVLWFHTAYDKYNDLWAFEVSLGRQPLPKWSVKPLLYAVPITEAIIGLLLFFSKTRRLGFWASTILMFVFTVYVMLGLSKVLGHLPCSCSKIIAHLSWREHLWLNIALLVLSIIGLLYYYPNKPQKIRNKYHAVKKTIYHYLRTKPIEDSKA